MLAYNADFDRRLLEQTAERYGLDMPVAEWRCVMRGYAEGRRSLALSEACRREGIAVGEHRALGDARVARELVLCMDRKHREAAGVVSYRSLGNDHYELVRGDGEPTETILGSVTKQYQIGPRGGRRSQYQFTWTEKWADHVTDRVVVHRTMRDLKVHVQTVARELDRDVEGVG